MNGFLFTYGLSFEQIFGHCVFGISGSYGIPHYFQRKKINRKGLGRGTLNTLCKNQGLYLKNGVDILSFER